MNIKKGLKLVVLAAVESRWLVVKSSKLVGAEVVGSDRNLFKASHEHVFRYITKLEVSDKTEEGLTCSSQVITEGNWSNLQLRFEGVEVSEEPCSGAGPLVWTRCAPPFSDEPAHDCAFCMLLIDIDLA